MTVPDRLPLKTCLSWGMGTVAMSILFNSYAVLTLRFMTDTLGIAAALAGTILLGAKVYDAITDPIMGLVTDRTKSRWGRRRPWLLVGAIVCATAFVAQFSVSPDAGSVVLLVALALILMRTGYTIFNIPYMAMAAEITSGAGDQYHQRSYLMSYRVGAICIGQLIGGALAPFLVSVGGGGSDGHRLMALVLGVCILIAGTIAFFGTAGARQTERVQATLPSFREQFGVVFANRPFLLLLSIKLLQLMSLAIGQGSLIYFMIEVLDRGYADVSIYFILATIGTFVSLPAWYAISRKYGKALAYVLGAILYTGVTLSWLWGDSSTSWGFAVRGLIGGVSASGLILMGQSMLPDVIDYDYRLSGQRREGIFAAAYTTVEKISGALGISVSGWVLGYMGYVASTTDQAVVQSDDAILGIRIVFAVLPALAMGLSLVALYAYKKWEPILRGEDGAQ